MAVIVRYVVEHKGVEKMVTTDKKEADQYDKMLDIADNIAQYVEAKGVEIEESTLEELTILMAKNKDIMTKLLKGTSATSLLEKESAQVVDMTKKKA